MSEIATINPQQTEIYRQEYQLQPALYYNELAERGYSLARLHPVIADFLAGRLSLQQLSGQLGRESRKNLANARRKQTEFFWRLNTPGRQFLESLLKNASQENRLNYAEQQLRPIFAVPASLEQASTQLDNLEGLLAEFKLGKRRWQALYLVSYLWSAQQPEWAVVRPTLRDFLIAQGRLPVTRRPSLSLEFSTYQQAFNGLLAEVSLQNGWELESFIFWSLRREKSFASLLVAANRPEKENLVLLENLRAALSPLLLNFTGANLPGEIAERTDRLELNFPDRSQEEPEYWLTLRQTTQNWQSGLFFTGFERYLLDPATENQLLRLLAGYLYENKAYSFLDKHGILVPAAALTFEDMLQEFALLKPLISTASLGALANDWHLIWHFAARLIARAQAEPAELPATYEKAAVPPMSKVAEAATIYDIVAPAETPALAAAYPQNNTRTVPNVARLKPAPLTATQVEGLTSFIQQRLLVSKAKISELITHLDAGRNILLVGPPGTGKTRLARLLAGQIGSIEPGNTPETKAGNYTLVTATAEWSTYDTIGGIRPGLASEGNSAQSLFYYFEPGAVARAALACEESLQATGRPHYLIIDEFNRANQERAFGELFTVLENRDLPLLPAARLGRATDLFLPDALRIIGTINPDDRNTVFEMGLALRRRFALVNMELPETPNERRFLPQALQARLPELELTPNGDFADLTLRQAADKLSAFLGYIRPAVGEAGRTVGSAALIECMVFCAAAARYYPNPSEALQDAVMANILPLMEGSPATLTKAQNALKNVEIFGDWVRLREAVEKYFRK